MAPQSGEDKIQVLRVIRRLNVGGRVSTLSIYRRAWSQTESIKFWLSAKRAGMKMLDFALTRGCVAASNQRDCHFFQSFTARPRR